MNIKYKMKGNIMDTPNIKVRYVWISPNWNKVKWYNKPIAFVVSCFLSLGFSIINIFIGRDYKKITKYRDDCRK